MSDDILGTSCDQCRSMVQYSFTSTETRRLVRTDSPGRPPRFSHSSWTMWVFTSNNIPFLLSALSPASRCASLTSVPCRKCADSCVYWFIGLWNGRCSQNKSVLKLKSYVSVRITCLILFRWRQKEEEEEEEEDSFFCLNSAALFFSRLGWL